MEDEKEESENIRKEEAEKIKNDIAGVVEKHVYTSAKFEEAVKKQTIKATQEAILARNIKEFIPRYKKMMESFATRKDAYRTTFSSTEEHLKKDIIDEHTFSKIEDGINSMSDTFDYISKNNNSLRQEKNPQEINYEYKDFGGVSNFDGLQGDIEDDEYPKTNKDIHPHILRKEGKTLEQKYPKALIKTVKASADTSKDIGIVNLYSKQLKDYADVYNDDISPFDIEIENISADDIELLRHGVSIYNMTPESRIKHDIAVDKMRKHGQKVLKNIGDDMYTSKRLMRIL